MVSYLPYKDIYSVISNNPNVCILETTLKHSFKIQVLKIIQGKKLLTLNGWICSLPWSCWWFLMSKISILNEAKIIIVNIVIKHSNKIELPKYNRVCFTIMYFLIWLIVKSNINNKVKLITYRWIPLKL